MLFVYLVVYLDQIIKSNMVPVTIFKNRYDVLTLPGGGDLEEIW